MALKLLVETIDRSAVRCLEEAVSGKDPQYFIEGLFIACNVKNKNSRIYPIDIMVPEVARYQKESIDENRSFGELCHPEVPSINLVNVSHMITSLKQDGTNFIGRAKLLDTPNGNICKALIREGGQLAVSTRGAGSLRFVSGAYEVQSDFFLSTVDIVQDPSAHGAFVRAIMEEREWVWDNGVLVESKVAAIAKTVTEAYAKPTRFRDEAFVTAFDAFLKGMSR